MSVYTVVGRADLESFLQSYELGALVSHAGITAGIENTNYFVSTDAGEFVLTLFEFTPPSELPFFLDLMAHLAEHGVVSAHPLADRRGRYLGNLKGRPAALVLRLPGASVAEPDPRHCAVLGEALARMHLATRDFGSHRANDRGPTWRNTTAESVMARLSAQDRLLLQHALAEQRGDPLARLPGGVIHADLFRDNALFEGYRLTGIIDFYYAHNGPFIYDLAVAVSDWCFDHDGIFQADLARAITDAYRAVRAVSSEEIHAWALSIRAAGLRFWLSRLKDRHFPRDGALTHIKDPEPFKRVLLAGCAQVEAINAVW